MRTYFSIIFIIIFSLSIPVCSIGVLEVEISNENKFYINEPKFLQLKLKNVGDTDIYISGGVCGNIKKNAISSIKLIIVKNNENIFEGFPQNNKIHSGISEITKIEPGRFSNKYLYLAEWYNFQKIGLYEIFIDNIVESINNECPDKENGFFPIQKTAYIEILPADKNVLNIKINEYKNNITNELNNYNKEFYYHYLFEAKRNIPEKKFTNHKLVYDRNASKAERLKSIAQYYFRVDFDTQDMSIETCENVNLIIKKTYKLGETISIIISVKNIENETIYLNLGYDNLSNLYVMTTDPDKHENIIFPNEIKINNASFEGKYFINPNKTKEIELNLEKFSPFNKIGEYSIFMKLYYTKYIIPFSILYYARDFEKSFKINVSQ